MIMKQMKRASKKGKTLTINKMPSSDDFRMNFRYLKLIESFLLRYFSTLCFCYSPELESAVASDKLGPPIR